MTNICLDYKLTHTREQELGWKLLKTIIKPVTIKIKIISKIRD